MNIFVDEYERQLDEKNRFVVPAKIREQLGSTIYITAAPTGECLHVYTVEEWGNMSEKVKQLPSLSNPKILKFMRTFYGGASACDIDKQGRVSLAQTLIDSVGLTKEMVLIGVNTRLEIWSKAAWKAYQESISQEDILESLQELGINI